ncbi:hypothetical protein KKF82_06200 [Patescibacteria group bacterium]|nr:hypothetical protein [Patescibacteria group bacterium]
MIADPVSYELETVEDERLDEILAELQAIHKETRAAAGFAFASFMLLLSIALRTCSTMIG